MKVNYKLREQEKKLEEQLNSLYTEVGLATMKDLGGSLMKYKVAAREVMKKLSNIRIALELIEQAGEDE